MAPKGTIGQYRKRSCEGRLEPYLDDYDYVVCTVFLFIQNLLKDLIYALEKSSSQWDRG